MMKKKGYKAGGKMPDLKRRWRSHSGKWFLIAMDGVLAKGKKGKARNG